MIKPLVVSVGMPRAGSGWYYNLIHDLIVASGGENARSIRKRFFLEPILTEINNNIGAFTTKRLIPVMIPTWLGHTYVVKAHAGPTPMALSFIKNGRIKASYIYRDPRDALLSAYEYGKRKRESGRTGAFSDLQKIEDAILFMDSYVRIAESWLAIEEVLHTRFESLLQHYEQEVERLFQFLDLDSGQRTYDEVIERYNPNKGSKEQVGTHFVKGKIGRYKEFLDENQKQMCIEKFGPFIEKMGYPVP